MESLKATCSKLSFVLMNRMNTIQRTCKLVNTYHIMFSFFVLCFKSGSTLNTTCLLSFEKWKFNEGWLVETSMNQNLEFVCAEHQLNHYTLGSTCTKWVNRTHCFVWILSEVPAACKYCFDHFEKPMISQVNIVGTFLCCETFQRQLSCCSFNTLELLEFGKQLLVI